MIANSNNMRQKQNKSHQPHKLNNIFSLLTQVNLFIKLFNNLTYKSKLCKNKALKQIHNYSIQLREKLLINKYRNATQNIKNKISFDIFISNLIPIFTNYSFVIKSSIKPFHNIKKSRYY